VQIYRWSGSAWTFVAPRADLFADAANTVKVGTHFGGPTWLSTGGSQVIAAVQKRCNVNPNDIPWLLLASTSSSTDGLFANTTYIQRVNTVGGIAPVVAGDSVGHVKEVPYTAEYWFYRKQ
jgi:hypothetical protein